MTDAIDIAIGVVAGKVIVHWREPVAEITFDPANAYKIGLALSRAALEAHGGRRQIADLRVVDDELCSVRVEITDARRNLLIAQVSGILKTSIDQRESYDYMAMHAVDTVLAETAR